MNSIWLAFITGLTTGGISCLAVQGGLLASSIAQREEEKTVSGLEKKPGKFQLVGAFLVAKIIAYTLLGFVLGLFGSLITLTPRMTGWLQIFAGLYMLAAAANLLNLHPIFRYVVIQPPKWVYKLLRRQSQSDSLFTPLIMGAATVLMPCGVTQAMMVAAVATGNPFFGAAILGAFTLGTSPIFFALGMTVVQLLQKRIFSYFAALVIIILSVMSINGGLVLLGSIFTLQNFAKAAVSDITPKTIAETGEVAGVTSDGKQTVTIQVKSNGYTSSVKTLKAGIPVELTLVTNHTSGCVRAFTMPALNISKVLPETGTEKLVFTPTKPGILKYTCGMGMYENEFMVI